MNIQANKIIIQEEKSEPTYTNIQTKLTDGNTDASISLV